MLARLRAWMEIAYARGWIRRPADVDAATTCSRCGTDIPRYAGIRHSRTEAYCSPACAAGSDEDWERADAPF